MAASYAHRTPSSGFVPPFPPPTPDEKNWAVLAHLLTFLGYVSGFLHIVAPLAIWLMKRDQSYFIGEHAKESLNAQISFTAYGLLFLILCWVLIGFVLLPILAIFIIVCVIKAALVASRGEIYRYPLIFRLIS